MSPEAFAIPILALLALGLFVIWRPYLRRRDEAREEAWYQEHPMKEDR